MKLNDIEYRATIETPIYSTEDPRKVKGCISNLFPNVDWEQEEKKIKGETKDLDRFKEILEKMHIRDTARSFLKRKILNDSCKFELSKQASCNAKINFSEDKQPLGSIKVKIESEELDELIESLTKIEDKK